MVRLKHPLPAEADNPMSIENPLKLMTYELRTITCPSCKGIPNNGTRGRVKLLRAIVQMDQSKAGEIHPAGLEAALYDVMAKQVAKVVLEGEATSINTRVPSSPAEKVTYVAELAVVMPAGGRHQFADQIKEERLVGRVEAIRALLQDLRSAAQRTESQALRNGLNDATRVAGERLDKAEAALWEHRREMKGG